jgi:hypothetical protein
MQYMIAATGSQLSQKRQSVDTIDKFFLVEVCEMVSWEANITLPLPRDMPVSLRCLSLFAFGVLPQEGMDSHFDSVMLRVNLGAARCFVKDFAIELSFKITATCSCAVSQT